MLSLDQRPLIGQNRSAGRELSSLRAPRERATGVIYNIIYRHFSANSASAPQIPRNPPRTGDRIPKKQQHFCSAPAESQDLRVDWGCRTPNPTSPERRRTPNPGREVQERHTAQSLPDGPRMSATRASIYPSTRCHQQVWVRVRLQLRVAAWPVRSGGRPRPNTHTPPARALQPTLRTGRPPNPATPPAPDRPFPGACTPFPGILSSFGTYTHP